MTRYTPLSLILLFLFIVSVGCGGDRPTVIENAETYQPSEIDQEMESAEYEKAMNELGNQ